MHSAAAIPLYLPVEHGRQKLCPRSGWNIPALHCEQTLAPAETKEPEEQSSHVLDPAAAAEPALQPLQLSVPDTLLNDPAGQFQQNCDPPADW